MLIDKTAKLITVLIQMDDDKVIWVSFSDFSNILISRNFQQFPITMVFGFFEKLSFPLCKIVPHKLIIEIKIILHIPNLIHTLLIQSILQLVLLLKLLFGLVLNFSESFFLFIGQVVSEFDL